MRYREPDRRTDQLAYAVIGAAIEVHKELGPGFLEAVYEEALCFELKERGIPYLRQAEISVSYKGHPVGTGYIDILVDNRLVVELKAVDRIAPIHHAQILSYLKATNLLLGLLINFNVAVLKEDVHRVVLGKSMP